MPTYKWPDGVTEERRWTVATIIWTIHDHGPIESEDGRATGKLSGLLKEEGVDLSAPWLSKTLQDLDKGGQFGQFIRRDLVGKRTYKIELTRDPSRHPFPDDPREVGTPTPVHQLEEAEPEAEEPELPLDLAAHADHIDDEIGTIDVGHLIEPDEVGEIERVPGVAIEPVAAPSRADRYLYIISMLNEMLTEEITAPQVDLEARLDARLTAVNAIVEENERLKKQIEDLKEDKRKLADALNQSNLVMRNRAVQLAGTNGTQDHVPV
jgi:hypothetical protein